LWKDGVMQNRGIEGETEVFRARGNIAIAIFIELFAAFNIWASCYQGGAKSILTSILVAVVISAANYAAFIKPRLIFSDAGLEIINPFSRHFVRWSEVEEIDARWCMTVTTGERTINAFGAPAPGRHRVRNIHESEMRGIAAGETGSLRPARSPRSDSGVAVHIALMWQARHAGRMSEGLSNRPSEHRTDFTALGIGAGAVVLALLINLL